MSWGVQIIGKPEKIAEKLEAYGATLEGQSKQEFEEAKPHLAGLAEQAMGPGVLLSVSASGHASFDVSGQKTFGSISVEIKQWYGEIAI